MKYGLIAERVGHSFSAEIHKKLFGYEYELKAIGQTEFDSFMIARNFNAINVTIPYKEKVIPYLDFIDDTAKAVGAVNTVVNHDGKLYGYNTDVNGFVALIHKSEMVFEGKKVLVLGSGGTSKTAAYVSKMLGCASVFRVSRNRREDCISYEDATRYHNDSEVIINTTPCGMFPDIGRSAIDIGSFSQLECVIDVVYNPIRTKLVTDARKRGTNATGGLYMLVAQAAYAAEKFIGKKADTKKIYDIYNSLLLSKQNVVLTGMPGCGKSAAGRCLSEKTGRRLIDTDELITEKTGQKPHEIINTLGEKAFRDIESDVIKEVSSLQGVIIATGGGAVLREENVDLLRENGRIYFLDRAVEDIKISDDRPLSSTRDLLKKRYEERYEIYLSSCDKRIDCVDGAHLNAELIMEDFNYENTCD